MINIIQDIVDYNSISEFQKRIEKSDKLNLKKKYNVPTDSIIITIIHLKSSRILIVILLLMIKKGFSV